MAAGKDEAPLHDVPIVTLSKDRPSNHVFQPPVAVSPEIHDSPDILFQRPNFTIWQPSIEEDEEEFHHLLGAKPIYQNHSILQIVGDVRKQERDEDFVVPDYARLLAGSDEGTPATLRREPVESQPSQPFGHFTLTDENSPSLFQRLGSGEYFQEENRLRPKFIGDYLMGACIGEGSYAKVKEVLHSGTLERYAVKIFSPSKLKRIPNGLENVKTEIKILRRLHHRNVCCIKDVLRKEAKNKTYVIMELGVCCISDLAKAFSHSRLPLFKVHDYFLQLMNGLEYCHSKGVIHKDIKPSNLVVTTVDCLKIIDFGVAEMLSPFAPNDLVSSSQGSPAVQSPEVAEGVDYFSGSKLDVWSAGVTLFYITFGRFPFEEETVYELYSSISTRVPDVSAEFRATEPHLCSLIDQCLAKKESNRLTIGEIYHHPWIRRNLPVPKETHDDLRISQMLSRSAQTFLPYIHEIYSSQENDSSSILHPYICTSGDKICDDIHCQNCRFSETASQLPDVCEISRVSTKITELQQLDTKDGKLLLDSKQMGSSMVSVKTADVDCPSFRRWRKCTIV